MTQEKINQQLIKTGEVHTLVNKTIQHNDIKWTVLLLILIVYSVLTYNAKPTKEKEIADYYRQQIDSLQKYSQSVLDANVWKFEKK